MTVSLDRECRCRKCGASNDRWLNYCPACGASGALLPLDMLNRHNYDPRTRRRTPESLGSRDHPPVQRIRVGIDPVDEVFGGGLPKGFCILLVGAPGAGKSTLLTQVAGKLGKNVLYVSTEESIDRVGRRAERVVGREAARAIRALSTLDSQTGVRHLVRLLRYDPASVIILDSLQGLRLEDVPSPARAKQYNQQDMLETRRHSQYVTRDIAMKLITAINRSGKTLVATSHMGKQGDFIGLREVEHHFDAIAWFTGTPPSPLRELRCSKNREADTTVTGRFEMGDLGLRPLGISQGDVTVDPAGAAYAQLLAASADAPATSAKRKPRTRRAAWLDDED